MRTNREIFLIAKENVTKLHCSHWQLVDRIPYLGNNRFSPDENRLFKGAFYPVMESEPYWTSWSYDERTNTSTRRLIKQRFYCDLPIKPDPSHDVRRVAIDACLRLGVHIISPVVLEEETASERRYNPGPVTYED